MSRQFSEEARQWLNNYGGSYDTTALLMAFDAGQQAALRSAAKHADEFIGVEGSGSVAYLEDVSLGDINNDIEVGPWLLERAEKLTAP